ncbi:sulfatase [Thermostilla marina]
MSGEPLNVLFILTEDQGPHLSIMGTPGLATPHMDELARRGMLFRNAHVVYPVCSASKAAIYTGLYCRTNGVRANTLNYFKPAASVTAAERQHPLYRRLFIRNKYPTFVELLHDAGYFQGVTHKLHVLPNEKFPFDSWAKPVNYETARTFFQKAAAEGKPWFLMYNIPHPHRPFRDSDRVPIAVDPAEVDPPDWLPDTPLVRKDWAEYLDAVQLADQAAGEVMRALNDSGMQDRTLIVFMGDHGPGFHRAKMALYDSGTHVPLVIAGPGIAVGACDALVSELDLMPTILEAAGIEPPRVQHGRSLWPVLQGKGDCEDREFLAAEIHHQAQQHDRGMIEVAVFDERYRLIHRSRTEGPRDVNADLRDWKPWGNRSYHEVVARKEEFPWAFELLRQIDPARLGGTLPEWELYDRQKDPYELSNVADEPAYRAVFERMKANWDRFEVDVPFHLEAEHK